MVQLAKEGIDKLTFILSPKVKYLGGWLEQLIAESTGKDGKGILPVDLEPSGEVNEYGKDRVFVYIKVENDNHFDTKVREIKNAGFPFVEIELKDIYQLGAEFFRWEFATAIAGYVLGVSHLISRMLNQQKSSSFNDERISGKGKTS